MLNEFINYEHSLESFAVSVWREAESCDDNAAWSRAYERLWGVQMFLTLLRQYPVANIAGELKAIAAMHAGRQLGFTLGQSRGEHQTTQAHQSI